MPLVQIPVGVTPCQIDDFPGEVVAGRDALLKRHKEENAAEKPRETRGERLARQKKEVAALNARPFERSCKGSLHLRPASTKILTGDELRHLRTAKQHAALGRRLLEVKVEVAKPLRDISSETKPPFPPEPPPAEEAPAEDEDKGKRKKRGG